MMSRTIRCNMCGVPVAQAKTGRPKTLCSRDCRRRFHRYYAMAWRRGLTLKASPKTTWVDRTGFRTRTCPICLQPFNSERMHREITCSPECGHIFNTDRSRHNRRPRVRRRKLAAGTTTAHAEPRLEGDSVGSFSLVASNGLVCVLSSTSR
jgi:predicted nucleic acid-binding Zn ribbon protein